MFTGIIEEEGKIKRLIKEGASCQIVIGCKKVMEGTKIGDSISVNGVCLTVTAMSHDSFQADMTPETMRRTAFNFLHEGSFVNLERALRPIDRMGGHMVLGHVDGVAKLEKKEKEGNGVNYTFSCEDSLMKYIVEKGSVAIDGISLTVAYAGDHTFTIAVIPHTGEATTISEWAPGSRVNIECDYLAKIVDRLLHAPKQQDLSLSMLENLRTGVNYGR